MEVKNLINTYNSNSLNYGSDTSEPAVVVENTKAVLNTENTQAVSDGSENSKEKDGYTKKELDYALKKINNFLKDEKTHAEYSIHKDFGTLMIKIIDDESDKVVLEIPPEKILDMVASMCRQVGLLDKKA